jgi:RNA polymerase sigma-70 factor (ECF subfamily)
METPERKPTHSEIISQLELLIDDLQDKLVHHAYFRLGNKADAEDVVQDAFLKIFNELKLGKAILNPAAYSFRLVTNACIDRLRNGSRFTRTALESVPFIDAQTSGSREEELIRQEEYRRINALLDSIPVEQSEIVRFRFVDGLHFQQIADILDLPLTTVKSRFSYGLQKIKTQFFNQKEVCHAEK